MKYKILISLLACSLLSISLYSQQVTPMQAQKIAWNLLANQDRETKGDLSDEESSIQILPLGQKDTTMYVVSTYRNWVLIAGDLRVRPILAYSDAQGGSFPSMDNIPPAMIEFLDWYDSQIAYIRDSSSERNIHQEWLESLTENRPITRSIVVSPLLYRNGLENLWGQSENNDDGGGSDSTKYYNKYCPPKHTSDENCGFTLAGCVAVATSQVMWYWQWPYSAIVKDDNGNNLLRLYDWSLMPTRLTDSSQLEQADMVATLLHDVGVAVNMDYGCNGSGANPENIVSTLRERFHYVSDTLRHRKYYPNIVWLHQLKQNLDEGKPILYGGYRSGNHGHRFVLDGYNSANQFHVNYGWKEGFNGYFLLDAINNSGDPYINNQSAIMNIHPNYPSCAATGFTTNDVNANPFEIYGGGNMISYATTISSNKTGVIYAGNAITLLPPFTIQNGANVHLAIKDMHCDLSDMDNQSGLLIDENDTLAGDVPERYNLPAHIELQQTEEEPLSKTDDSTPYNLLGQPVDENYHGIVIQNGQKRVQ